MSTPNDMNDQILTQEDFILNLNLASFDEAIDEEAEAYRAVCDSHAAALARITTLEAAQRWIPVATRLPECEIRGKYIETDWFSKTVLLLDANQPVEARSLNCYAFGSYSKSKLYPDGYWSSTGYKFSPTHWRHIVPTTSPTQTEQL